MKKKFAEGIKQYHFEWKHLLVLFVILIIFQIVVSYIQKITIQDLLYQTQDWYKQDTAEKLANITATSLELLLETNNPLSVYDIEKERAIIRAFNIILSQQLLQQNVEDVCVLVTYNNRIYAIDNGRSLFNFLYTPGYQPGIDENSHGFAVDKYGEIGEDIHTSEQIHTIPEGSQTFHVFVPLVPSGEYAGSVYLKIRPDFTFITRQIIYSYGETALVFSALIFFGLLAMFYISSYTVKERDETQKLLFEEREKYLREQINHQKEALFTKRIYHTHHKAEKIMGFIKEDLQKMTTENIGEINHRVTKYANFISRVIYDMKWYDPPLHTFRSPMFKTDLNEVIKFIVNHISLRISKNVDRIGFDLNLDRSMPVVSVNEFVAWEIIEPLIQNSIDHSGGKPVRITLITSYDTAENISSLIVEDNGDGLREDLLEKNESGVKKIFLENISTKTDGSNAGYGCYLAYEIAKRCNWQLDAENLEQGGCRFVISITNG